MATTIGPTYDPQATATALAEKYTAAAQQILTGKTSQASAVQKGLTDLRSAISGFQSSLSALTGLNKSMYAQSAVLSDTTLGSATATAGAAPGTYNFFIEQVARAHQVAYNNIPDNVQPKGTAGTLGIKLGSSPTISVDMTTADADGNGTLSVREVAAAINKASSNTSLVSAAVVTVGGVPQLMLNAQSTGTASAITLDTSALGADLKAAFDNPANFKEVTAAQDAKVWIGAQGSGTLVTQSSNTFTNVDGVKLTVSKAQAPGADPVSLTVGPDTAGTTKNVQDFVDAYNKLKAAIDKLVDPGDPEKKVAAGPFAHDAGMRALRDRLVDLMRPSGSASLAAYGITGTKGGGLVIDAEDLLKKLAADPNGLDTLIGSASLSTPTGIAGKLNTYLTEWSNSTNGKIKSRSEANERLQKELGQRQTKLDSQYDAAYQRYLLQFTKLQNLQAQMSNSVTMFDALFGNNKNQ